MTTQDDKPESNGDTARTQLRPSIKDWTLKPKDPASGETITVQGEMTVGREECDIVLTTGHISRRHAKLTLADDTLRVEDLGSTNGTFVNEEKIESSELKPGDEVRFDTEAFVVDGPAAAAPAEPEEDNRTVLRPAAEQKAEPQKEPEPEKKSDEAEGEAPSGAGAEDSGDDDSSDRRAWYERETPNMTQKVQSSDLRNQFATGATEVVRGVQNVEMPSLIGTSGNWSGHIIKLDKEAMTIGRSGTDIVLDEPSVSTKHAQIVRDGERWKVVDLMSANGIYVNGKKTQVAFLSSGDAVRFGQLELRFVTDSTHVSSRAAPEEQEIITGSAGAGSGKDNSMLYIIIGFVVVVAAGAAYLFLGG